MSVPPLPDFTLPDLGPFRRRIRLLRAWRCAAQGGCIGAGVALVLAVLDYFDVWDMSPWKLAVPVGVGLAAGIVRALCERLPETVVARSVDRRALLADRLTSAAEVSAGQSPLAVALHADASGAAHLLRPARLYPLRAGRWQAGLLGLAGLCALVFMLGNTALFRGAAARRDAAALRREADQVQRVARPLLESAARADAAPEDKALARKLNRFASDLRRARLSRPQALLQANILAQQAQALQTSHASALAQSVQGAQTAGQMLAAGKAQAGLEKTDAAKLADQARTASAQVASLQKSLSDAQSGKSALSAARQAALKSKLASAQKQLQQIKLSEQAQQFLAALHALPDYKEAQLLLAKLAAHAQAQQAGQQSPMTAQQMQQAADRLEALANEYGTDAKMHELARKMLEAARAARAGKGGQCAGGLMEAFGLGAGGLSLGGSRGAGAPSPDKWVGDHGTLARTDKSSVLHVPLQDRQISSQMGHSGPETYTEVLGPSAPVGSSGVPYQSVLPRYEKTAEAALSHGDVPPRMRAKVRDYFDSLRK